MFQVAVVNRIESFLKVNSDHKAPVSILVILYYEVNEPVTLCNVPAFHVSYLARSDKVRKCVSHSFSYSTGKTFCINIHQSNWPPVF